MLPFYGLRPSKIIPYLGGTYLSYRPHNMGVPPPPRGVCLESQKSSPYKPHAYYRTLFFFTRGILQVG